MKVLILNNESDVNVSAVFDSSVIPVRFDLTGVVPGFNGWLG